MLLRVFRSIDMGLNLTSGSPLRFVLLIFIICLLNLTSPYKYYSFSSFILARLMSIQIVSTYLVLIKESRRALRAPLFLNFYLNILGLFPYAPPITAHLIMTAPVSLILWLCLFIDIITKNKRSLFISLLPENTPNKISRFLSLVEGIRNIIRPGTLRFRLAANLRTGHVILGMMASRIWSMIIKGRRFWRLIGILSTGVFYTSFEIGVGLIQAFVFILLISMYSNNYLKFKK